MVLRVSKLIRITDNEIWEKLDLMEKFFTSMCKAVKLVVFTLLLMSKMYVSSIYMWYYFKFMYFVAIRITNGNNKINKNWICDRIISKIFTFIIVSRCKRGQQTVTPTAPDTESRNSVSKLRVTWTKHAKTLSFQGRYVQFSCKLQKLVSPTCPQPGQGYVLTLNVVSLQRDWEVWAVRNR